MTKASFRWQNRFWFYRQLIKFVTSTRFLLPPDVCADGGEEYGAFDHVLDREMDSGLVKAFVENANDDGAEQGA
jgi:hypothetical protein